AAVRASVLLDPAPALCFDLGGGSLEIMVGDRAGLLWSTSLKLGVARLTAELVDSDPLSEHDQRRLRDRLTALLAPVADVAADLGPKMAVGTSGTFCDLARMVAAARYGRRRSSRSPGDAAGTKPTAPRWPNSPATSSTAPSRCTGSPKSTANCSSTPGCCTTSASTSRHRATTSTRRT